ncbi:sulfite exporter TauE/SafE family protein [Streptomyces zhihengii]|uniref:sulfite exporter TauE/SafE family protein n=1 Tax=Streptomyces zhihengii TaxID=1818004 RepID=UPI0036AE9901
MTWSEGLLGFAAGLLISVVTAPVGVSGAVFLLPVQVSLLGVPSPAVTPTNLLYNVVAGPGALLRHRGSGQLRGPLARLLIAGAVPGVVAGAAVRVFAVPGPQVFRLFVAALLLPLGLWLCARTLRRARPGGTGDVRGAAGEPPPGEPRRGEHRPGEPIEASSTGPSPLSPPSGQPSPRATTLLAAAVGVAGGIYGIGGGSLLGPILVGRGMPVARVAPAALACTFVTSVVGAATYALLALTTPGTVAPDWLLGIACGLGGLAGGYLGARLQPRLPETGLRLLLGVMATGIGLLYAVQGLG